MATATIRDLRNHFLKVKKMVETEGEVIVTDKGHPKYKLTLYTPAAKRAAQRSKDYIARLRRHQRHPISKRAADSLDNENRGDR
jgi:antitoxin (DNA-binding transcriptional repressor) of toxin-antitoxin stability system